MNNQIKFFLVIIFIISINGNKQPKLTQSPSDVYGLSNQQVSLRCETTDNRDKISWLKDDRVILTDSKLLVFQLNTENEGYYFCNVSNQFAWILSDKAIVRVAYLQQFPDQNITEQYTSPGSTVLLQCPSIEGLPPPSIEWQANNSISDTRFKTDSGQNLRIDAVQRSDSGYYWCRAKNIAFTRLSSPIHLIVIQKPMFLLLPKHLQVMQGSSVQFSCIVTGESPLLVHWYKLATSPTDPSLARVSLASNCSLFLNNVRLYHTGAYVARATNRAGITEIVFKLSVISPPSFIDTPDNGHVTLGQSVWLSCTASGTPTPRIFWYHDNDYLLSADPDGSSNSRVTIFDNGTLFIASARSRDAGTYHCYAASIVGVSRTLCSLKVDVPATMFAPVIAEAPENTTTVEGATTVLRCRVLDPSAATVTWYKQSLRIIGLNSLRGRHHLLANGDLQISNCKLQDSATYTCRASLGSLYSDKSARLFVKSYSEVAGDPAAAMIIRDSAAASVASMAVTNVSVEFIGDTYLLIKWDAGRARPGTVFRVEAAAQGASGWTEMAATKEARALVAGLKTDTGYKVLVRWSSADGAGVALLHEVVYTLDKPTVAVDSTFADFHKQLQDIEVLSVRLASLSSSQLLVSWKVRGGAILRSISGFVVKAEPVSMKRCLLMTQKLGQSLFSCLDNDNGANVDDLINSYDDRALIASLKVQKYVVQRSVDRERTKASAIVGDLRPFVCYEVEIETFIDHLKAGRISGRDSVTKTVLTYDDLPARAPRITKYRWIDNGTFLVTWEPLDTRHCNGPITGYLVQLVSLRDKSLNTIKVSMNILQYKIRIENPRHRHVLYVSANSCRGPGPRSWPVFIQHNSNEMYPRDSALHRPWVIAAIVGSAICAIFLIVILISICICKRQRSNYNNPKLAQIPLVTAVDREMEESFSKRKKIDKSQGQRLLSNYETLSPNFLNSSDGFSTENCPSSGGASVPRFACGSEDSKCSFNNDGSCQDSLAYASSSIIYKGCQHYTKPGMNSFPSNFYGPYIDILNDQRITNPSGTDPALILNPVIPPPPLYPPPPAPKNQRNYSENATEGVSNSQNNTHSSGSASACDSSNKSNKTRKSRTSQSVNQSLNSSSSSKSQRTNSKMSKSNRINCQSTLPGDPKKKDSQSNSTNSSHKTGDLSYQALATNSKSAFQLQEATQDDQSEAALTSEISDTDTGPCDPDADQEARDTDSLRVMYKLPAKRPLSTDYSTDSSYQYSLANHYSSAEPPFPMYPNNMPTKF